MRDSKRLEIKLECLRFAVEASASREPKTVPVLDLAETYYKWILAQRGE